MGRANKPKKQRRRANTAAESKSDKERTIEALRAVKLLQGNGIGPIPSGQTAGSASVANKSVGSFGITSEATGSGLEWYEKYQDEKLSGVETRLNAHASDLIYETRIKLESKLSTIKTSMVKYLVSTIVAIIIGFIGYYFIAFESIESKLLATMDLQMSEFRLDLDGVIKAIKKIELNSTNENTKGHLDNEIIQEPK